MVVTDAGYGTNADFRAGITARGWHYVCQVQGRPDRLFGRGDARAGIERMAAGAAASGA